MQTSKDRNRDIYIRAGRNARKEGRPISSCPKVKRDDHDTYGAWLEKQWREAWLQQDDELQQLKLPAVKPLEL